ncbi:MAG: hypothetical protein ABEN55_16780, partial [Bradymonadaceae bacterium]
CGGKDWYDMADESIANRVRNMEAEERQQAPTWVRAVFSGGLAVVLAALVAGIGYGGFPVVALAAGTASVAVVPVAYYSVPKSIAVWLLRGRQRMPHRWHVPTPLPEEGDPPAQTLGAREARPVEETLEAPISGRECLVYQVCVLFDTPGDARPPEWALEEQRGVDLILGEDLELTPDRVYLESPVEMVRELDDGLTSVDLDDLADGDERHELVKQFLRQRGLFAADGEFHFYEARLEPGDEVEVSEYDGGTYILRDTDAESAEGHPELPRPGNQ